MVLVRTPLKRNDPFSMALIAPLSRKVLLTSRPTPERDGFLSNICMLWSAIAWNDFNNHQQASNEAESIPLQTLAYPPPPYADQNQNKTNPSYPAPALS